MCASLPTHTWLVCACACEHVHALACAGTMHVCEHMHARVCLCARQGGCCARTLLPPALPTPCCFRLSMHAHSEALAPCAHLPALCLPALPACRTPAPTRTSSTCRTRSWASPASALWQSPQAWATATTRAACPRWAAASRCFQPRAESTRAHARASVHMRALKHISTGAHCNQSCANTASFGRRHTAVYSVFL